MPHVLVAGKLYPAGIALLEGDSAVSYDYVAAADPEAYIPYMARAEALIIRTQALTAETIALAPKLRIVSRHGVGFDAIDVAALDARRIPLAIVGDVNSRAVAEHAMMLLLASARRLTKSARALRGGDWVHRSDFEARELDGKTLLIIGFGRIGRRLAVLAQSFGMRVMARDPYLDPDSLGVGIEAVPHLHRALQESDFISLHAPRGYGVLLGRAEFEAMKPGVVIVNTARGSLIDEEALIAALAAGKVGAAGLDVLEVEPPSTDHPLFGFDNVIVTPHSAGLTEECARRMAQASVQNALDYFRGELDPALVVNLKSLPSTPSSSTPSSSMSSSLGTDSVA